MNKAQFIEALATRLDTDRRAAQTYLDAVFDQIYATVSKGEEVVLTGFGKFEKRDRAARTARNPATGAPVRVKKTSVPGFKAGTEFKAIVSGAKKIAKAAAEGKLSSEQADKLASARNEENADLFDFELSGAEMAAIDGLDQQHNFGPDPATYNQR